MKTSYNERDYPFGQAMLTLRTAIGLTQAGLAKHLGVSRRAVGEWEAGGSYPKVDHLKELITLGVKQQAFTAGQETEEIRQFWKAAHQKVLLDEQWLSVLLYQQRSPHLHTAPVPVGGQGQGKETGPVATLTTSAEETKNTTPALAHPVFGPRVDWGEALAVPDFYGREEEQSFLFQWVEQERCRVVSVLGMGGIGKSALVVSIMYQLAEQFEVVIFRSLRDAPALETLLDECLQVLSPEPISTVPATLEQRMGLFLQYLRKTRALVVLDNLESLLQEGDVRGQLRPGFEGYGQLLHRVAGTAHQSCLLLTSREKPAELRPLEGKQSHSSVRSVRLTGLDDAACSQLFEEKEVVGTKAEQAQLIEVYGGNPLALKIVGETIFDLFGGEIGPFLAGGTVIFGSITDLLEEQFARLSALEQSMLCWLAIVREPVTLDELHALQVVPLPRIQLLEAVDAGYRRSLIERGKRAGTCTLQSVVMEYVTGVLIAEGSREIQQRQLKRLIEYGLEQATAREYVRKSQEGMLLSSLLADLQSAFQRQAAGGVQEPRSVPTDSVKEQLLSLLNELRGQEDSAQGYGPANLIALLRLLRGDLSGLDLSHLSIRGAYLQSIDMHDASLAGAVMRDTVLTEAVNASWAVAISSDGKWWAAGSMQGKVRVWNEGGRVLHLIWQAHSDSVQAGAFVFSPDGRTLATGGGDGTVKLWDVESGALLWMGQQYSPISMAFSPDGSLLACGGLDATVRLWDAQSGTNLQTLTHASAVFAVAWSADGRFLASGCFDGQLRLWEKQKTLFSTYVEILSVQTIWVIGLAFAPDGRTLASANRDRTVKLWEVPDGHLLQTLPGEMDLEQRIIWSPDGRTLACSTYDKAIWLWDVEQGNYRVVLRGHSAGVFGMAFTPDSHRLFSGGADGTLRVWDVLTGHCEQAIQGYGVSLYDVDWSPDGTYLVSGDTSELVTVWDLSGGTPPRELRGHRWIVWGVGWSPDGRWLASSAWDPVLRLWDPTSGASVQMVQDYPSLLLGLAWSPDGSLLACGTLLQGVRVWETATRRLRWQTHVISFNRVAWSPDSTWLAGGGDDGNVYLWEGTDGTQLQQLSGHGGRVMSVGWSPDGRWLASGGGGSNGEMFVWDACSGDRVQTFVSHPCEIYTLTWSPSGDRLISGGSDGMLRWWNVESGECVRTRKAHQGTIQSLRVSRDGRLLASCGHDGAIMICDLESGEHLRTLRRDRPYERLNITDIRGLNEAQKESLRALGAIEDRVP